MSMGGIKCFSCGEVIPFKDFRDEEVGWIELDPIELKYICLQCLEKAKYCDELPIFQDE